MEAFAFLFQFVKHQALKLMKLGYFDIYRWLSGLIY